MSKKILVIAGSPRLGGNSDTLADAFIAGAKEAGHEVTKFNVAKMHINGCQDCKYCFSHDAQCVQQDDMQQIYPHFAGADILVLATPVYFFGMTAQIRAFLDRLYAYAYKGFHITGTALLILCGDTDPAIMDPPIAEFNNFAAFAKLENKGVVKAAGVNDKGEIDGNAALQEARQLGKNI